MTVDMVQELRIYHSRRGKSALLVGLPTLIREIERVYPHLSSAMWTIFRGADGYGESVCDLANQLDTHSSVDVRGDVVIGMIADGSQYFDNVRICVEQLGIEFGNHDSTFLFFRGPPATMRALAASFQKSDIVVRPRYQQ